MRALITVTFSLSVVASVAQAEPKPTVWRYGSAHGGPGVELVRQADGLLHGHAFTENGACTGEFFGTGSEQHGLVILRNAEEKTDACIVAVAFDSQRARVVEDRCLAWHGAGCSFSGVLPPLNSR